MEPPGKGPPAMTSRQAPPHIPHPGPPLQRGRVGWGVGLLGLLVMVATSTRAGAFAPADDASESASDPAAVAFFERAVRPILVERCQACHGPRKSKGDLRLDSRAAVLAGGQSGPAVVSGAP